MRALLRASLALSLVCGSLPAHGDSVSDAEELVVAVYYEGLPYDDARALDDAGVARLAEMLADPGESTHHGNIVLALGMSGGSGAFEALTGFASSPVTGEVDRAEFRARTQLGRAMGYLCHDDPRALAWLLRRAGRERTAPGWSFRQHRGDRLASLLEDQVLVGLAMSGTPSARTALERARAVGGDDDAASQRRRRTVDEGLRLHTRVARDGRAALRPSHDGGATR
jgi:hypothetical protein